MACLSANIQGGGCLTVNISLASEGLKASVGRIGEGLKASVGRIGEGLKASVGLVCTPNTDNYIRVSPNVIWFMNELEVIDVEVYSNIKWIVK